MTQEELIRERDFYRAKLEESDARVKTLEFDLAELQKRDVELSKRVQNSQTRVTIVRNQNGFIRTSTSWA